MTPEREKEIRELVVTKCGYNHWLRDDDVEQLLAELDRVRTENQFNAIEFRNLAQKLDVAVDLLVWLSPCGQCTPAPTYELIGEKVRDALAKIKGDK